MSHRHLSVCCKKFPTFSWMAFSLFLYFFPAAFLVALGAVWDNWHQRRCPQAKADWHFALIHERNVHGLFPTSRGSNLEKKKWKGIGIGAEGAPTATHENELQNTKVTEMSMSIIVKVWESVPLLCPAPAQRLLWGLQEPQAVYTPEGATVPVGRENPTWELCQPPAGMRMQMQLQLERALLSSCQHRVSASKASEHL